MKDTYDLSKAPPWLPSRILTLQVGGSHAYGMNTPESDVDFRGLCIPPKEFYLDPFKNFEQFETHEPSDLTIFSITKFFRLAADCNPNVIEILFVDDRAIYPRWSLPESDLSAKLDLAWKLLRKNKKSFLSSRAAYSFSGYAMSQLKRIKSHRAWLLNPPDHKPVPSEFGLSDEFFMGKSDLGVVSSTVNAEDVFSGPIMELYHKSKEYYNALQHWNQYQSWCQNRNPARAENERKFGYDTKHGAHLVRLLRMGKEILTTGEVNVLRPDAAELLDIRRGAWKYDELVQWAEETDLEVQGLAKASTLPHSQENHEKLGKLHQALVEGVNDSRMFSFLK